MRFPRPELTSTLAIVVALAAGIGATTAAASGETAAAPGAIVARDYNLGLRLFPQPGMRGKFASMPVRLWGTIAAPAAAGPHPVVLVAHGAHGDNCPGEYGEWPCYADEQRNDLGLRYLVRALARAGFVAVAMDVNAAYTGGWGELQNQEQLRFGQVLDATVAELRRAGTGASSRFGVPLEGKVDLSRLGLVGHSRGGLNMLRWGKTHSPKAVVLVAPAFDASQRIPNVPTTVLLGTCDGDTGNQGARYVTAAAARPRTAPVVQLTLTGANHNFYNQTLVRLRQDDAADMKGACAPAKRLRTPAQQAFLARIAVDQLSSALLGTTPAPWLTGSAGGQLYGQKVAVRRVAGRG